MKFKKMNINNYVKVKLNDTGLNILKKDWNDLRKTVIGLHEWKPPEKDENGYSKFQLWSLMECFGKEMYLGNPNLPFDSDILVEVE